MVFFITLFHINANAAVIIWIGVSGSNWNKTVNWSTSAVPTSNDDVIFNSSVVVDMDILSATTYTINSLLITNNSNM